MKQVLKKGIGVLLILTMVLGMTTSVFASTTTIETEEGVVTIIPISDTKLLMSDGNDTAITEFKACKNGFYVEVTDDKGMEYFHVDKSANTIYSSITGKTQNLSDFGISADSARALSSDPVSTETFKISYAQIADAVGTTASVYSIASYIVAIIGAATMGIALISGVAFVMGLLKGKLLDTILAGIKTKSGSHGIKVVVGLHKIYRHQGGNKVPAYSYSIDSIGTY